MDNEIKITIDDQTKDGEMSQNDLGEKTLNSGTRSKASNKGSKRLNKTAITSSAFNATDSLAGGTLSKGKNMLKGASSGLGLATLALAMANALYQDWKRRENDRAEHEAMTMQYGGRNRGEVNRINSRTQIITGRIKSQGSSVYRNRR